MPRSHPAESTPHRILWTSLRALVPTLIFDIGVTMGVYYLLLPHFSRTSLWPILGASLVPVLSNVFNFIRRHAFDMVGLIVLVGLFAGLAGALFGGNQRLLLVRESFITGLVGLALLLSLAVRKPIGYYVVREFLTANEALPHSDFDRLWRAKSFRRGIRVMTAGWGALLLGEFALRVFLAFTMSVAFVLGVAPVMFTVLLLAAGAVNAFWLSREIKRIFDEPLDPAQTA